MDKRNVIGIDLAKNTFHCITLDHRGKTLGKKKLSRKQMKTHFANIPPAIIAMEACASAHYWGRILRDQGHEMRLLPPQHVKPYVRGNKNDYNDALAIAEAASRPQIRSVAIKSPQQQDMQGLERMREQCTGQRTAVVNQLRGLLAEYGIVLAKGVSTLTQAMMAILEEADNGLSDQFRRWLYRRYEHLQRLTEDIDFYTQELHRTAHQDARCRLLNTIPGYGLITASTYLIHVGDTTEFRRGRDVSASVGIVPKQHSTGGRSVLLGISKRGNKRLRYLLIHGARSVARHADGKTDALSVWFCRLRERRGYNKAVVALANKMARIGWAVLKTGQPYQAKQVSAKTA